MQLLFFIITDYATVEIISQSDTADNYQNHTHHNVKLEEIFRLCIF